MTWPVFTGPLFPSTLAANAVANVVRNLWAFIIIFCGHFPTGAVEFTEEECEAESKGHWYFRQVVGSANIRGGRLFHIMCGTSASRLSTISSPTSRPGATGRSPPRSGRSAGATASRTTRVASHGSSAPW